MVHLRARTSKCRAGRKEDIEPKLTSVWEEMDGWPWLIGPAVVVVLVVRYRCNIASKTALHRAKSVKRIWHGHRLRTSRYAARMLHAGKFCKKRSIIIMFGRLVQGSDSGG